MNANHAHHKSGKFFTSTLSRKFRVNLKRTKSNREKGFLSLPMSTFRCLRAHEFIVLCGNLNPVI